MPHNVDGKGGLAAKDGSRPVDGCDVAEDSGPEPNSVNLFQFEWMLRDSAHGELTAGMLRGFREW